MINKLSNPKYRAWEKDTHDQLDTTFQQNPSATTTATYWTETTNTQNKVKQNVRPGRPLSISPIDPTILPSFWMLRPRAKSSILVRLNLSAIFLIYSDISLNPENPQNGKQFCVNVNVRNVSSEDIVVDLNSVLHSCFYTGRKHKFICQDVQKDQTIKANSGESFKFDVPFEKYSSKMADDQMSMKCAAVVKINTTQKSYCDFIEFQMTNPSSVTIEVNHTKTFRVF